MAGDLKVDVIPSSGLERSLNAAHLLGVPTREFLKAWGEQIKDEAVKTAPEDLGRLRGSHRVEVQGGAFPHWSEVVVDAPYAKFVHDGTGPHWMPVLAIQGWADRHGVNPYAVQRSIAVKGTKAQPWLKTAAEKSPQSLRRLLSAFGTAIAARWGK